MLANWLSESCDDAWQRVCLVQALCGCRTVSPRPKLLLPSGQKDFALAGVEVLGWLSQWCMSVLGGEVADA